MSTDDELNFFYLEDLSDRDHSTTESHLSAHALVGDAEPILPEVATGLIGLNALIEQQSEVLNELVALKVALEKNSVVLNM